MHRTGAALSTGHLALSKWHHAERQIGPTNAWPDFQFQVGIGQYLALKRQMEAHLTFPMYFMGWQGLLHACCRGAGTSLYNSEATSKKPKSGRRADLRAGSTQWDMLVDANACKH